MATFLGSADLEAVASASLQMPMVCYSSTYTLEFGGRQVGTRVHGHTTDLRRATPVNPRHNHWGNCVILDGGYPAILWTHDFTLYVESATMLGQAGDFYDLVDLIVGVTQSLLLKDASGATVVDFGSCYFDDSPSLEKPESLLLTAAGFHAVKFLGNTKPVHI